MELWWRGLQGQVTVDYKPMLMEDGITVHPHFCLSCLFLVEFLSAAGPAQFCTGLTNLGAGSSKKKYVGDTGSMSQSDFFLCYLKGDHCHESMRGFRHLISYIWRICS
jgi:hypothetical protein